MQAARGVADEDHRRASDPKPGQLIWRYPTRQSGAQPGQDPALVTSDEILLDADYGFHTRPFGSPLRLNAAGAL